LGAGLDTRGYRFADRLGGVRFFEVDHPSTQAYKRHRAQEVLGPPPEHVRYVPVDFAADDLLTALRAHGDTKEDTTHFGWQGVVGYLPEEAVRGTLRFVRDHAAAGSTLALSYPLRSNPSVNNPTIRAARWGEPWLFGFPGESAAGYLEQAGLTAVVDEPSVEV